MRAARCVAAPYRAQERSQAGEKFTATLPPGPGNELRLNGHQALV